VTAPRWSLVALCHRRVPRHALPPRHSYDGGHPRRLPRPAPADLAGAV